MQPLSAVHVSEKTELYSATKIEVRNSNDRGQNPLQTKIRKEEKDKVRSQI